ncbi:MAG: hypothetical protein DK306_001511, partial [Chloroflexi bacterium]
MVKIFRFRRGKQDETPAAETPAAET